MLLSSGCKQDGNRQKKLGPSWDFLQPHLPRLRFVKAKIRQSRAAEADPWRDTLGAEDATTSTFHRGLLWSSPAWSKDCKSLEHVSSVLELHFLVQFQTLKIPFGLSHSSSGQNNQDASLEAFPTFLPERGIKTETKPCSSMQTLQCLCYFLTRGKQKFVSLFLSKERPECAVQKLYLPLKALYLS